MMEHLKGIEGYTSLIILDSCIFIQICLADIYSFLVVKSINVS